MPQKIIKLVRPVVNLKYKKKILTMLRNRCRECYSLLSNPIYCLKCKALQHKISLKGNYFFEGKNKIYTIEIKARLEKIPNLKEINKLILTKVKISSEKKYKEIGKINNELLQKIRVDAPERSINRLWNLLQSKANKL